MRGFVLYEHFSRQSWITHSLALRAIRSIGCLWSKQMQQGSRTVLPSRGGSVARAFNLMFYTMGRWRWRHGEANEGKKHPRALPLQKGMGACSTSSYSRSAYSDGVMKAVVLHDSVCVSVFFCCSVTRCGKRGSMQSVCYGCTISRLDKRCGSAYRGAVRGPDAGACASLFGHRAHW